MWRERREVKDEEREGNLHQSNDSEEINDTPTVNDFICHMMVSSPCQHVCKLFLFRHTHV